MYAIRSYYVDAADRQHEAAQADLAGHREVAADRAAGQERREREEDRDAGARPVLRDRAGRHVDVHLAPLHRLLGDSYNFV